MYNPAMSLTPPETSIFEQHLQIDSPRRERSPADLARASKTSSRTTQDANLPRSASYTYFPRVKDFDHNIVELKGSISEEDLTIPGLHHGDEESTASSGTSSPDEQPDEQPDALQQLAQTDTADTRYSERTINGDGKIPQSEPIQAEVPSPSEDGAAPPAVPTLSREKTITRSPTKLRRKSWMPGSRSTSPTKSASKEEKQAAETKSKSGWGLSRRKTNSNKTSPQEEVPPPLKEKEKDKLTDKEEKRTERPSVSRRNSIFSKKTSRPSTVVLQVDGEPLPKIPSLASLPKSFSTERLPSFTGSTQSPERIPPLPRNASQEKLKQLSEPRKKDELWSVFRSLDADYQKFQSKSIALKANVVRSTLLPFLRNYGTHASNRKLRAEDLDRRTNILNKWWIALLEMLQGRNNQSLSGTDRPVILDGIAGIMERPEWRLHPSPYCPISDRMGPTSTPSSLSTTSLISNLSQDNFLAESVNHNVRNTFVQNLLSQMAFVVDKMSLRNAAASLVAFCGKTCAYAFMFCPGVADVLVRLWGPTTDTMRRVLGEAGVSRQDRLEQTSKRIVAPFPPNLHGLKFTSTTAAMRYLRKPASIPLGTANLPWYGPWMKRWSGTESDLFYVFVKHYHILIADFLPPQSTNVERICAPGLLMVHSQILVNLDATIHRHTTAQQEEQLHGPANVTFDDVLGDPDASATTLPALPTNATRLMAENRLIMLIRDCLSERNTNLYVARHMFAEAVSYLLTAAAKGVPIYDHSACYTLCDFLEEAFALLIRYEQLSPIKEPVIDWKFWLSVFRAMADSQNTTTEIRLYTLLYTSWNTLTSNHDRKLELCYNFLLEPEFFESRFNHWCPMVRAYFMRLLCWRVARFDGEGGRVDVEIFEKMSERLRQVWAHFIFLAEEADIHQMQPPSSAPCNPAPGRRLLIIRTDAAPMSPSNGSFLSFDGFLPPSSPASPEGRDEIEVRPRSSRSTASDSSDFGKDEGKDKKRWSLLRSIVGTPKSRSKSQSPGPSSRSSSRASIASADTVASAPPKSRDPSPEKQVPKPAITHRAYCFRFSLEWVAKDYRPPGNMRLYPPRLPLPAQQLLFSKIGLPQPAIATEPLGEAACSSRYAGRALAEWALIVNECHNFFERRKNEGVPNNKWVETPTLGVEAFRRPG